MCEKQFFSAPVDQNERCQNLVWVSTPRKGMRCIGFSFPIPDLLTEILNNQSMVAPQLGVGGLIQIFTGKIIGD